MEDNDIASALALLHELTGADFSRQVEQIAMRKEFHPIKGYIGIYAVGDYVGDDYPALINAANKAVSHGYNVYILPNPTGSRTADFIFERKGTYRLYELKTILGKDSASNRLLASIGQSNRVLLNMATDYKPSSLARSIKRFFERNSTALEILIFKGKKLISISRELSQSKAFYGLFMKKYTK